MRIFALLILLSSPSVAVADDAILRGAHAISAERAVERRAALVDAMLDRARPRYERMRAASALSMVDRPEVRAALARAFDARGDDVEVRAQALHALAFLDDALTTPRLERAAASEDAALRDAARVIRELRAKRRASATK